MDVAFNKMFPYISSGYTGEYINKFYGELTFGFVAYTKSQIDVDVVSDLYNRNIFEYYGAYKYFKGDNTKKDNCTQVLKFFYEDIASMICSVISTNPDVVNECSVKINTVFPNCSDYEVHKVFLADTKEKWQLALKRQIVSDPGISAALLKIKGSVLADLEPSDMLATASILMAAAKSPDIYRLEVVT